MFGTITAQAQQQSVDPLSREVALTKDYHGSSDSLLTIVGREAGITISYSSKVYVPQALTMSRRTCTVRDVLEAVFNRFPVEYIVKKDRVIVAAQRTKYCRVSGLCKDALTGEVLIGANVYDTLLYVGSATNDYGFFGITLPAGRVALRASFVGYRPLDVSINVRSDTMLTLRLQPVIVMEDVIVTVDESELNRTKTGTVDMPMEQVKAMPTLLGEADIIKAMQKTPGVHSGEEGFGGMSVRGGGADQNIVLLDDVPLYNPNHMMGLFTLFNSDGVNSATLIKSGFPARYGGRMSSVLDIKMKEGNSRRYQGYVNVGLLASNATLEGPIIKDKMSFTVSARRTYFDLFTFIAQQRNDEKYSYYFYDVSAKLNYKPNVRNALYVSFFTGYDHMYYGYNYRDVTIRYTDTEQRELSLNDAQKLNWGNLMTAVRWNHVWGKAMFSNVTASFSRFRFKNSTDKYPAQSDSVRYEHEYYSGINDAQLRVDFTYYTPFVPGTIRFGANATYHYFNPGLSVYLNESYQELDSIAETSDRSFDRFELHGYVEDEFIAGPISANIGLHVSMLNRHDSGLYVHVEPRALLGCMIGRRVNLKVGYAAMSQFVQLMRLISVASPADLWLPVSSRYSPPRSWQVNAEASIAIWERFTVSAELYYKRYIHAQTYSSSPTMEQLLTGDWESLYCTGRGNARGAEVFVHKKQGRITGWASYSLSKAVNKFDAVNDGRSFPADNDRRHSVSLFGDYKVTDDIDIAAEWSYNTGAPLTLSDGQFSMTNSRGEKQLFAIPGRRNAYRMPNSHALVIGCNIRKVRNKTTRQLSFGIYNVYGRCNPMFVYWNTDSEDGQTTYKLKQFSLMSWPCPYIRYSIRF